MPHPPKEPITDHTLVPITDGRDWQRLVKSTSPNIFWPLQQSWAYGEAIALEGQTCKRFIWQDATGTAKAALQVFEKSYGFLQAAQLLRGPVWLGQEKPSLAEIIGFANHIAALYPKSHYKFLFWTPELTLDDYPPALKHALPFRPIMTGYSTPIWDLTPTEDTLWNGLEGNWRTAARKAMNAKITVKTGHGGADLPWVLSMAEGYRKKAGYYTLPPQVFLNWHAKAAPHDTLLLTASLGTDKIAGILILKHGHSATYQTAWTSDIGRSLNVTNVLLWQAALHLKQNGVQHLDLGGVDTEKNAGIARFKLGTGAEVLQLAGTFL